MLRVSTETKVSQNIEGGSQDGKYAFWVYDPKKKECWRVATMDSEGCIGSWATEWLSNHLGCVPMIWLTRDGCPIDGVMAKE